LYLIEGPGRPDSFPFRGGRPHTAIGGKTARLFQEQSGRRPFTEQSRGLSGTLAFYRYKSICLNIHH
jgi:hypothetical protein